MPARTISIDKLQPIDSTLSKKILEEIAHGKRESSSLPEVWIYEGLYILTDGHHRVYDAYQRGKRKILALIHSRNNCSLTEAGYGYALEEALSGAAFLRDAGIFHISQLQVQ
jgi:hypothetical protein